MAHPNARLTSLTRWDLVQMVRGDGYMIAEAARRFNVSRAHGRSGFDLRRTISYEDQYQG